jgi:diguanylate cyclase (GGDEF)-like protein
MSQPKSRWGIPLFAAAVVVGGACLFLNFTVPFAGSRSLYEVTLPWIGLGLSVLAFLVGHFSYPRVQNLKVYLVGYLMGVVGVAYFLLYDPPVKIGLPKLSAGYLPSLLVLAMVNLAVVLAVPSFVKYRITKSVTFAIAGAELGWLLLARLVEPLSGWAQALAFRGPFDGPFWIGIAWLGIVVWLSVWRLRDEFFLGGILAGTGLLYAMLWVVPTFLASPGAFRTVMVVAIPLYLEVSILVHWFSRIEHRVAYDPLLHIYNRNYCTRIITEQSNMNTTEPFTVAMVDIDHFKKVNDTYGHQAGDAVLVNVAQTIGKVVVPDGVVCRYGGEEMAVFFPQMASKEALPVMERVREAIEKMKTVTRKKTIKVTVSCGISHREERSQPIMDVIHAADKALYRAKEGGRNQVRVGKTASVEETKKNSPRKTIKMKASK